MGVSREPGMERTKKNPIAIAREKSFPVVQKPTFASPSPREGFKTKMSRKSTRLKGVEGCVFTQFRVIEYVELIFANIFIDNGLSNGLLFSPIEKEK